MVEATEVDFVKISCKKTDLQTEKCSQYFFLI